MTRETRLRGLRYGLVTMAIVLAVVLWVSLRMAVATDFFYSRLVKDPERTIPHGANLVAPADGTVLYVRRFEDGQVPIVIKKNTPIPVESFHRMEREGPRSGLIIGIYMNTFGVHINRAPIEGRLVERAWYNGPQMDMSELEKRLILSSLVPGPAALRKIFGLAPEQIYSDADFITHSARETMVFEGVFRCYVVRIADYYVGKVVSWVKEGDEVEKGQKIGLITWGSQTDLIIETDDPERLKLLVEEGDYVRGGESIIATYQD